MDAFTALVLSGVRQQELRREAEERRRRRPPRRRPEAPLRPALRVLPPAAGRVGPRLPFPLSTPVHDTREAS